ncbi:MAG: hypothetical protein IKM29_03920 [Clostridia bacterium]|nr:hypothetical protein [Clostridia bacterium]
MAHITSYKTHESGIALGGIGTGSVELLPDGEFHFWQIANPERWTTVSGEKPAYDGEENTGALSFWVRTEGDSGEPVVRKLGMKTDWRDFTYRMYSWNKPVERIEFDGRFPVCGIEYFDRALPCKVSLEAVAPFVPHSSKYSATPGFYLNFTLENPTDKPLKVSLMGAFDPSLANGGKSTNVLWKESDAVRIQINPEKPFLRPNMPDPTPNFGNMTFALSSDGEISYLTGEYGRFIKEYIPWHEKFGVTQESFIFDYRKEGRLPNSEVGRRPEAIPEVLADLSDEGVDRLCAKYCAYPHVASFVRRIGRIRPGFPSTREEKLEVLEFCSSTLDRLGEDFGSCALASEKVLAPGEKTEVNFVFSWYFPNHYTKKGERLGHFYENLFGNSLEANRFLNTKRRIIEKGAKNLADLLYSTDLPSHWADAWSVHLSTIVKDSWWLADGKFGLWEGLGYCGFHTTDITYHASFGLLALFPDLQMKQMKMGADFQREDGRVHHFFTPDLSHVDNGFDRVDMNPQFVLMVARDYLFTGDKAYLESLWENVVRAMESSAELDSDGDGLPDKGTKRNTYDAWNFSGAPTYICVLWLAALKAAVRLAEVLGDGEKAKLWSSLLEKGKVSLEEKLWNGKYYDLWRDETQTDGCLMTDQLDGEWYLRMMGLGGNLSDERVRDVVRFIFENNFDAEDGLINATCPADRSTSVYTYLNCQAEAVWTGIGYAFAALAVSLGIPEMADKEILSIHENQMRFGSFWDHWECGYRYTRPLSSWSTLNAALGLKVDGENRTVTLNPMRENITLPLCLADCLARAEFAGDTLKLTTVEGDISGWKLVLPEGIKTLVIDGEKR